MPEPNITGLLRGAIISMPVGLLLLVAGAIAIAAGTTVAGAVLLVLAVLSVSVGCLLMLTVRGRARAISRGAQARWQAQVDAASRDERG